MSLRKQFEGTIIEDSKHLETEFTFIFKGRCAACGTSVGQLLRVCKKDWGDQKPSDEEVDTALMGALAKNHLCDKVLSAAGLIVGRA